MSYINGIVMPVLNDLVNFKGCIKTLIGGSEIYLNLFGGLFDKDNMKLEDLPDDEKIVLKKKSLIYCPQDRMKYCKAITYFLEAKKIFKK